MQLSGKEAAACAVNSFAILIAIVVLGVILLGRAGNTLVDWLWFSSIGYEDVFWTIFPPALPSSPASSPRRLA